MHMGEKSSLSELRGVDVSEFRGVNAYSILSYILKEIVMVRIQYEFTLPAAA